MNKSHITIAMVITIISSCCSSKYNKKDFVFTSEELDHFSIYKPGDTFYFQSNLGDIDTINVIKIYEEIEQGNSCFISKASYSYKSIEITHLPVDKWQGTNENGENGEKQIDYQTLFSISKFPLEKKTNYSFSFKNFANLGDSTIGELQKECLINNVIIYDCYKIKHSYPERILTPNDIEIIYWTDKYGLTAYTSKSGETWLIKN